MVNLEMHEAQLFRYLVSCFGKEQVILHMSAYAVCEEQVPEEFVNSSRQFKCLFTIIDDQGNAKLVIDFAPDFTDTIDMELANSRAQVKQLLNGVGIHYIGVSRDEFDAMKDPESSFDLYELLELKVEQGDISL